MLMITQRPLRFGIKTTPQKTSYDALLAMWREADALPIFEHAWISDHFIALENNLPVPCLEAWTLLAALAAQTSRLRIGVMVSGNTYRHPAVLANMAATVDHIAHGRLDFGIGTGWQEREHHAYGIPLYAPGERIRRLDEACEVIRRLWTEPGANFEGRFYQLHEAYCEPGPLQKPHPPFVIGGNGNQMLRVVARYADIWDCSVDTAEEYRYKSAVLDDHCTAIGRDPATIERSRHIPVDVSNLEAARQETRAFIAVGATHIIYHVPAPYVAGNVRLLAEQIAEPLRTEYQQA